LDRGTEIAKVQPNPFETVPSLALQRVHHVDATARRKVRCRRTLVERDRLGRGRSIAKVNP
jgi:hypothetical protein